MAKLEAEASPLTEWIVPTRSADWPIFQRVELLTEALVPLALNYLQGGLQSPAELCLHTANRAFCHLAEVSSGRRPSRDMIFYGLTSSRMCLFDFWSALRTAALFAPDESRRKSWATLRDEAYSLIAVIDPYVAAYAPLPDDADDEDEVEKAVAAVN